MFLTDLIKELGHPSYYIGALIIGLIGSFLPLTLYSGQNQLLQIVHNPVAYGIGILLRMMVVKMLLTNTSFATGLKGVQSFHYYL